MANEFGEDPAFYIWPTEHEDGTPFPEDFYDRLWRALKSEGLEWEHA